MEQEELKQALRNHLSALSKEELVEIIANVTSVYVAMTILSRTNLFSNVQQCVDTTMLDIQRASVVNAKEYPFAPLQTH